MGRYHPSEHDSFIRCDGERCGAKNAPEGTTAYTNECWRCGEPLGGKPETGEIVTVDVVDEDDDGKAIGKTEGGFVLFLDDDVSGLEATVEVDEIESTYGRASIIEQ